MSISSIQKLKIFERSARNHYVTGEKPRLIDIMRNVSKYFATNPAGLPKEYDPTYLGEGSKSDVKKFNERLSTTKENLDTLYEASFDQVGSVMMLGSMLRTELDRLDTRRQKLLAKIDDYLFSLYNTDGYYYSFSDNFADLSNIDLLLSSIIVNTELGGVLIPSGSAGNKKVQYGEVLSANVACTTEQNDKVLFDEISQFSNAIDGLSNTAWIIEVDRDKIEPIVCTMSVSFNSTNNPPNISKLDFDPYGMTPVQVFVEALVPGGTSATYEQFGNSIQTSTDKMLFVDQSRQTTSMKLTLIKRTPDYTMENLGKTTYRYIFGAKELAFSEYFYDRSATLVSAPIRIDPALTNDQVIDAVTLTTVSSVPTDTDIQFYVAADLDVDGPKLSDFEWKNISPIDQLSQKANTIVDFNGAATVTKNIKPNPSAGELQLIQFDTVNSDLLKRNPSPSIIPGTDIYRLAKFEDTPLTSSLLLEEGVNTIKIYHVARNTQATSLSFWKSYIDGSLTASTVYGQIDAGNDFFYGGDVGQNGRSVYVETYLESLSDQPLMVKSFKKSDPNSRQWNVKVFLNGRQVADLPVGTDEFLIPWSFTAGLNHIALMIDIPPATETYPTVYIGTLDLMGDSDLFEFGTVKLANWDYVDFFNLQYNQVGQPTTFNIYNGEIISRRKPTSNFRIRYSKPTDQGPSAIRLRADLTRVDSNPNVTPILKSYRLRFLYGDH